MAVNYTVIFPSRYHLGNEQYIFAIANPPPFVGKKQDWTFDCPDVDPRQTAVLLFQSYDVTTERNFVQINGFDVVGGLPVGPPRRRRGQQAEKHLDEQRPTR